jgi:hypothetical protein
MVRGSLVVGMSRGLEGRTKAEVVVAGMSCWNVCEAYVSVCACVRARACVSFFACALFRVMQCCMCQD